MTLIRRLLATIVVIPIVIASAKAEDTIEIRPVRISSIRYIDYLKPGTLSSRNYMTVSLRLKGKKIAKATRIGKIKIETAEDNLGNALKQRSSFSRDLLAPITRMRSSVGTKPNLDEAVYYFMLNAAKREAKTLAKLKGTVTVVFSDVKTIQLDAANLESLVGKKIDNPGFKEVGFSATVERFSNKPRLNILFKFQGEREKRNKLLRVEVVDAKGQVFRSRTPFAGTKSSSANIISVRRLPPGAKVRFVIEQKTQEETLKFSASDLTLP